MTKLYILLTVVLLLFSFQNVVEAHSGRTDSNGGHNCTEKSIAKGLCTGYHYHNGGSSSSSSSSSSNTSIPTTEPEEPVGPTPEEIADQEKNEGEEDGYAAGLSDGYNETDESNTTTTGSDAYEDGYTAGYQKGIKEGRKKLNHEKEEAFKTGYDAAKEGLNTEVPEAYIGSDLVQASYKEGYEKGISEIEEVKKEEYYTLGNEDGKKDKNNEPNDIKDIYLDSYKDGYEKGQQELKDKYVNQGYEAAYTMLKYESPTLDKEKYEGWYKEGFDSNQEIKEIKNEAHELGLSGATYELPHEYEKAEVLYEHYYDSGKKEYDKEKREDNQKAAGGMGVVVLGWLVRRFYVARKTINN
ncbi:YHYH domain-containing protein [Halobacillus sp. Marseille-Q1614]|uniref:YHYH domain-containing protein n=1 Tax=Halobacillus sp. Marseille-Q1614 TaxID=2709134 RepID=UPI0015705468|nr:YHYH domain-containing protein [Halobacillus sp. Marseille-Q1614]